MTTNDIKTLISSDESRTLELKKTTGELKDGMHSACAFLNTEGGWLIFGVTPEHPVNWSINGDFIVVTFPVPMSPSQCPPTAPLMVKVAEHGIPVISEIEFGGRYTDARMVCITGSNGKTTTTMLIYHILRKAGLNVGLAGNVGRSLARQVAEEPHDVYVVELIQTFF